MFIECRISPESLFEKWSNDEYGENFRESYKVFEGELRWFDDSPIEICAA